MSGTNNNELSAEQAKEHAKGFMSAMVEDHKSKILEQCLPKNKRLMLEQYIAGTRIQRHGMDEKGVRQVAERFAEAMVKLFAAYISRDDDVKVQASLQELAVEFNKGSEPKEESKIILLNK